MFRKALALICTLSVVVLAGCTSGTPKPAAAPAPDTAAPKTEEKVTLTYWHTYNTDSNENKVLNEVVIPAFQKKYPNITVKSVVQPNDGLHDSLVTAAAGGTTPDIMRMDIIWTPEFAKLGALEDLSKYPGFDTLKNAVFPGPLATNTFKGKYYGMPLDTNTQVTVYNPEWLKAAGLAAPPKTVEELKQYLTKTAGKDKYGLALGGTGPWQFLPLLWTYGGKVTNDDYTKATGFLNSDDTIAAVTAVLDLYKQKLIAPTMTGGQPGTWEGFKAGQYGAVIDGPWFFGAMANDLKGKMVGAPLPAGKGGSISVVGGENIVMFKNAKNKEAAWKFIEFALSDEAQVAMAKTGQMPVTKTASANAVMKETGYYDAYVTQLQTAMPRTPVATWNKIDKVLSDAMEAVFRGADQPKSALDKAAKEIDALLAQ
jgi:multiple sugar transport system substrate-binding protein